MGAPVKMRKVRARKPKRHMVLVDRDTLFFPSQGDPDGVVHVIRKWGEAQMMASFLLTAIARASIDIDSLDLKGTAQSIKDHVERAPNLQGVRMYPGDTMIAAAIETIQNTRDYLASLKNAQAQQASPVIALH